MKAKKDHPFFAMTYQERMGVYVILVISLAFWLLPRLFWDYRMRHDAEIGYEDLTKEIFATQEKTQITDKTRTESHVLQVGLMLHAFDPNVVEEKDWIKMGLDQKTAKTIRRYLEKGGRFRKPEDLRKIWGMDESLCEKLLPYINIPSQLHSSSAQAFAYQRKDSFFTKSRSWREMSISINLADSATWESLPGIGPALAHRIISYRNKLGGFASVDQLSEVWNLPDSVFQKIKHRLKPDEKIRTLDLNQAGMEEFGRHPYFGFRLAKLIVNYREQHGLFQSLEDIQKIVGIDKNKYDKIRPYLKIGTHPP